MQFHTTEQLGPKQSLTPDGFLLCEGVPIARTGIQRYTAADFPGDAPPIEPGPDGWLQINRDADQVFREETIASFEGKPVVIGHTFVTPENFQFVAVGHVQNVRRGKGLDDDLMLGDFLINDASAIERVRAKLDEAGRPTPAELREVSCGYEADYEQTSPGYGRQLNIIGNHVAIVDRGRAGSRCAIQDKETTMKTQDKATLWARIRKAFNTKDATELEAAIAADESEETEEEKAAREAKAEKAKTGDSIAALTKTVDALAVVVAKLVKSKDDDSGSPDDETTDEESAEEKEKREAEEKKTADAAEEDKEAAAMVGDSMSRAEILLPGFKMPTADSIKTRVAAVALQRQVLAGVAKTEAGAALLAPFLGKRTVDALTADTVGAVFVAASEVARAQNNAGGFKTPAAARTQDFSTATQIADINKANAAFWSNRK